MIFGLILKKPMFFFPPRYVPAKRPFTHEFYGTLMDPAWDV